MSSVSGEVKVLLENKPFLLEALGRGILSLGNLAEVFKPEIEKNLKKEVKNSAIVMALRRYGEDIKDHMDIKEHASVSGEIIMKTNICDFNVRKSPSLLAKIKDLYALVSIERGDFLNITVGNNEISVSVSERYYKQIESFLNTEVVYNKQKGLVSLTVIFSGDFLNTPGIIFQVIRRLVWENINLLEIVSTMTELTIVIDKNHSFKAYEVLQRFLEGLNTSI